jgi:acyl-CoA thioester hydrolase
VSRTPFRGREHYKAWREIGTRWGDNDAYGHVNNVVYYSWFDTAVNAWLIEQGLLDIESGDPIGLVVETGCRYARPLAYPEPVEIGLAVETLGKSSIRYVLGVFAHGQSEAAAEGHFVHVYVGREDRRPAELPPAWRQAFAGIAV